MLNALNPTLKKGRRSKGEWVPVFLKVLASCGNVQEACQAAHIHRGTAYDFRDANPDFAAQWQAALEDACDILAEAAWQRAMNGSDTLLIFLLKAYRPEKFRENFACRQDNSTGEGIRFIIKEAERPAPVAV